jgi:hypothetical protein
MEIAKLHHGQHACFYYETAAEQLAVVEAYIAEGLKRRERCLYIAAERTINHISETLHGAGVDVDRERRAGALQLCTARDVYVQRGRFDAHAMITFLAQAVDESLRAGFQGLRASGEMTWILANSPGTDSAGDYEALLNRFFPRRPALGLCQYHRGRFAPDTLHDTLRSHPCVLVRNRLCDNLYYEPPEIYFGQSQTRTAFNHRIDRLWTAAHEEQRAKTSRSTHKTRQSR